MARNVIGKLICLAVCLALPGFAGCSGDVTTTDDSTKMEAEVPKVETGEEPADLDPSTDDDIDVDTPLPGDT
jgi:hypothetical protein